MRVGVISDTHGLLRPEAIEALRGSDLIIHAGDIGDPSILAQLSSVAPVFAVRGNNDRGSWADEVPVEQTVRVEEQTIFVVHDLAELRLQPQTVGISVVVSGHSHKANARTDGGVLFFNPGSAGPRRFKLPITVGELLVTGDRIVPRILELPLTASVSSRQVRSPRRSPEK